MNRLRLVLTAAVLCPLVGCEWMKEHGIGKNLVKDKDGRGREPLQEMPAERFVGYLNERADRLQSITDAQVLVSARDRLIPLPALRGTLVASQPRSFRMITDTMAVGAKVDLGSNDELFWVYAKVPANDPVYLFAAHSDFQEGRARIPGGIPFEPEWVMQAFGMAHFPPNLQYASKLDERARTYTLSWPATTPAGVPVVKEIVFDADGVTGNKPQVKKHTVRAAKTSKPICYAEIKEAKAVQIGTDPRSGQPLAVQYPTKMLLRWEEQKFEMELELQNAKINQPPTPEEGRRYFSRPNIPGATPINLAKYDEFPGK